jgi:hypothetical protein
VLVHSTRLLVAGAISALFASSVTAEGERWVHHYRGQAASVQNRAYGLTVHPSGEFTALGLGCSDLQILRIGPDGQQLWLQTEEYDTPFVSFPLIIASGEDVIVSSTLVIPYLKYYSSLSRFNSGGDHVWEHDGGYPFSCIAEDGAGGVVVGGNTNIGDLCPCPGFVGRYGQDGTPLWGDLFEPVDFPERLLYGTVDALATDGEANSYVAGTVQGETVTRVYLRMYSPGGQVAWERAVFPESASLRVTGIAPGGGAFAVVGFRQGEAWLARYGPDGEMLWLRTWPALFPNQAPILASTPDGVSCVAMMIAGTSGSDIRLTAYSSAGDVLWERIYDSGSGSADSPSKIVLGPDGSIFILGSSNGSILVIKFDPAGALVWDSSFGIGTTEGSALAVGADGQGFVAGSVTRNSSEDLLILAFDTAGEVRVIATLDDTVPTVNSQPAGVTMDPEGGVLVGVHSYYPCRGPNFDLIRYGPDGSETWVRNHPVLATVGFNRSGSAAVGSKHGSAIDLLRYDASGDVAWSASFQSVNDQRLNAVAVSDDEAVFLLDVADLGDTTTVIAVSSEGGELWRRTVEGRASGLGLGPEGRVYLQGGSVPRIDCLSSTGEPEWSRVIEGVYLRSIAGMVAAEDGSVYLIGQRVQGFGRSWTTLHLHPGGDLDWVEYEESSYSDADNRPHRLVLHPDDGVVVTGQVASSVINIDARTIRYGAAGGVIWRASIATDHHEVPNDLVIDPGGNVRAVIFDATVRETRTIKYGPQGEVLWNRRYEDQSSNSYPRLIALGDDLSVAVVGPAAGDSVFTLKYEDPFPVEITSLFAQRTADDVSLTWSVAPGLAAGFEVLHATVRDDIYRSLTPDGLPAGARSYLHNNAPPGEAYYFLEVLELDGSKIRHGPVQAVTAPFPTAFWMAPPSPNPAASTVQWQLGLPASGRVRLVVHDVAGRAVAAVADATLPAGVHRILWDRRVRNAAPAPAGVYFFHLEAGSEARVGKLVLGPLP